jgi:hypothetical protein
VTIERAVERLYRNYENIVLQLYVLTPRVVTILSDTPKKKMSDSQVEKLAIKKAELSRKKEFVQRCYACMTKDEKYFIRRRYYDDDVPNWVLAQEMGYSPDDIYKLKESVIAKTIRRAKKEGFKL